MHSSIELAQLLRPTAARSIASGTPLNGSSTLGRALHPAPRRGLILMPVERMKYFRLEDDIPPAAARSTSNTPLVNKTCHLATLPMGLSDERDEGDLTGKISVDWIDKYSESLQWSE